MEQKIFGSHSQNYEQPRDNFRPKSPSNFYPGRQTRYDSRSARFGSRDSSGTRNSYPDRSRDRRNSYDKANWRDRRRDNSRDYDTKHYDKRDSRDNRKSYNRYNNRRSDSSLSESRGRYREDVRRSDNRDHSNSLTRYGDLHVKDIAIQKSRIDFIHTVSKTTNSFVLGGKIFVTLLRNFVKLRSGIFNNKKNFA